MKWISNLVEPISSSVTLRLKGFDEPFSEYLRSRFDQLGLVRTIVDQHRNVSIESVYVQPFLAIENNTIDEKELLARLENGESFVIEGFGGSGKSMLVRTLWRTLAKRGEKVPLLAEMRNIRSEVGSLTDYILKTCFGNASLSQDQFHALLSDGRFVILLDGFDELSRADKKIIEEQVLDLAERFPSISVVVTGRHDPRFSSWIRFTCARVVGLTYKQFCELIDRIDFEPSTKAAFQKRADEEFFNKHVEFLSNPLLALMMLVSFGENAEIPSKLSIFYKQCFDALFRKHDAMKQAFERERALDRIDFERVFSVFSFLTHQDKQVSFGDNYFHEILSKSLKYLGIGQDKKSSIEIDMIEAVNLIAREGDYFFFIHRSFQEYFAAWCVTRVMVDEAEDALTIFADDQNSTAFKLCCELHEDLVIEKYLIPEYNRISNLLLYEESGSDKAIQLNTQNYRGKMGCQTWLKVDGSLSVYLNGWTFRPISEVSRFYRCAAHIDQNIAKLEIQRKDYELTIPGTYCTATFVTKEDKSEVMEQGSLVMSLQNGEVQCTIEDILDVAAITEIERWVNKVRVQSKELVRELEWVTGEMNLALWKLFGNGKAEKPKLLQLAISR
ncbi:NACHT domain-containing protein [Brucella sp. NBRC 12950]|uniref:NACHT domain-containing protein n=1 Tax=Brucella sp. NBRC 12950 TaxID=2994518 RepID=UPI0024A4254B|nr:NACHT domain-containing protein [Brucella sp. NBRC 12950]GLU29927.1 hypothetical protein Brsp01_51600 [Brucella sp. NBRC 12950]